MKIHMKNWYAYGHIPVWAIKDILKYTESVRLGIKGVMFWHIMI